MTNKTNRQPLELSEAEKQLIIAYRKKDRDRQRCIRILLDLEEVQEPKKDPRNVLQRIK